MRARARPGRLQSGPGERAAEHRTPLASARASGPAARSPTLLNRRPPHARGRPTVQRPPRRARRRARRARSGRDSASRRAGSQALGPDLPARTVDEVSARSVALPGVREQASVQQPARSAQPDRRLKRTDDLPAASRRLQPGRLPRDHLRRDHVRRAQGPEAAPVLPEADGPVTQAEDPGSGWRSPVRQDMRATHELRGGQGCSVTPWTSSCGCCSAAPGCMRSDATTNHRAWRTCKGQKVDGQRRTSASGACG